MRNASPPVHIRILTTAHPVDDGRVSHKFAPGFRTAGFRVLMFESPHKARQTERTSLLARVQALGRRPGEAFLERHNWEKEIQPVLDRIQEWRAAS